MMIMDGMDHDDDNGIVITIAVVVETIKYHRKGYNRIGRIRYNRK